MDILLSLVKVKLVSNGLGSLGKNAILTIAEILPGLPLMSAARQEIKNFAIVENTAKERLVIGVRIHDYKDDCTVADFGGCHTLYRPKDGKWQISDIDREWAEKNQPALWAAIREADLAG